ILAVIKCVAGGCAHRARWPRPRMSPGGKSIRATLLSAALLTAVLTTTALPAPLLTTVLPASLRLTALLPAVMAATALPAPLLTAVLPASLRLPALLTAVLAAARVRWRIIRLPLISSMGRGHCMLWRGRIILILRRRIVVVLRHSDRRHNQEHQKHGPEPQKAIHFLFQDHRILLNRRSTIRLLRHRTNGAA
ncbi:MAG TPA: hypothetical protein VEH50_12795, partial [Methylomirabilota bacterium]|nr:hypothetical protein [Methylomirabilota bacterium]